MTDDTKRGLYAKYAVMRTDGSSAPYGKHYECRYFVLDLDHDKHARAAIEAYAKSCETEYPVLARDLRRLLKPTPRCGCRSASHELCGRIERDRPSFGDG